MHRSRALTLPLIALAAAALVLTGCSSDGDSGKDAASGGATKAAGSSAASAPADEGNEEGDAEPAGSGKGSAHLTYSGGESGEFTVKSVGCSVLDGKLAAITAPDSTDGDADATESPAFTAVMNDGKALTTLTTAKGKSYLNTSAPGITADKSGKTWTITVAGLELGPADPQGDSITVDGTIDCGSVAGF
ncbi:hypothetical protein [Streptomyces sp. BE230]|uniref:hypothetical protein n=1 Tax=Streptomyces sp. BE230 TaxID=3002526 RepID=UPI002ED0CE66|nr:hypothetical protein [Streptomyces sp. BE230]